MKTKISQFRNFATDTDFRLALEFVLEVEGHMSNDPDDKGGLTKYGISQNAYPDLDIANLDFKKACEIYYKDYWLGAKCDKLPPHIAMALFGAAVNHGVSGATKLLQDAVNTVDDGIIGPNTIRAIQKQRNTALGKFLAKRAAKYASICIADHSQTKFLYGWNRRIFKLHHFILKHCQTEEIE